MKGKKYRCYLEYGSAKVSKPSLISEKKSSEKD
jgi:hypothetical protein